MSLANIQGKLSRAEMKNIMAGTDGIGLGCEGNACGGGGSGTCGTKQVEGVLQCVCSVYGGVC